MRVLLIHGDKGGPGKTEASTRTAAAFAATGRPVRLIDGDARNPRLYQLFNAPETPVRRCNILKTAGIEEFFEEIAREDIDTDIMIDMPAGAAAATERFFGSDGAEGSINIDLLLREKNARAVVLFVIDQNREPIAALRDELNAFPADLTTWVVVKNHFQRRPFTDYDNSKTRGTFLKRGGREIDMARLDPTVTGLMSSESRNLISIHESPNASMIAKIRAKGILNAWIDELKKAEVLS